MEQARRNLSKFDKIVVELDDLQSIIDYVNTISEEERTNTNKVLEEAILTVYKDGFPSTNIYFNINESSIDCEVYVGFNEENTRLMAKFKFNNKTGEIETFDKWKNILKGHDVQKDLNGYVFWVSIVSLYITHIKHSDEVSVEEERVRVAGKNKHKSKSNQRYTYISRKKYTLKAPSEEQKQKRQVIRHVDSWSVRGHIRRLKNGKEIWINPHVKGSGELKPKTYKVTP